MSKPLATPLGAAQAEADSEMLRQAFLETADYQALRHTTDFSVVVGRRGTGKSAIYSRLGADFEADSSIILLTERPQDFEMLEFQALLKAVTTDYRILRTVTRLLWTSHLLLEGARAVATHYRFSKCMSALFLREYVKTHARRSPVTAIGYCVSALKEVLKQTAVPTDLPRAIAAHFDLNGLSEALSESLLETGMRIVALYDRLDEAWVPETASVAILGGLAKAAADHREKQYPLYLVMFVRDNMFRALAQMDDDFTRHIEGHTLRIQWSEDSLFHLVASRLRVALSLKTLESPTKVWNRFAHRELSDREGFGRCLRHTLYRPRDIVVLLNCAYQNARRSERTEIVEADIDSAAASISQNRLEDLCKEYDKVLPGLRLFIFSFKGQPAQRSAATVVSGLEAVADASSYDSHESRDLVLFENGAEMFSALYSVGFIGVRDASTGHFMFCHDGTMVALGSLDGRAETLVHPCYWKALDAVVTGDTSEVLIQVNDEYSETTAEEPVELRLKRLGRLPEELSGIPSGMAGSKAYETWVLRAVRLLFSGELANIALHPNPHEALNQRDVVGTNMAGSDFWRRVHADYQTRQVIFECKNYAELKIDDFRQMLDYGAGEYGRFSIVVRRGVSEALTDFEKERTKAAFYDHKRIVMVLPVPILTLCIRKLRTPKKYDYTDFTMSKQMDYLVRSVLVMTHPPKYLQKRKK